MFFRFEPDKLQADRLVPLKLLPSNVTDLNEYSSRLALVKFWLLRSALSNATLSEIAASRPSLSVGNDPSNRILFCVLRRVDLIIIWRMASPFWFFFVAVFSVFILLK